MTTRRAPLAFTYHPIPSADPLRRSRGGHEVAGEALAKIEQAEEQLLRLRQNP
jgi:hypothetical protein